MYKLNYTGRIIVLFFLINFLLHSCKNERIVRDNLKTENHNDNGVKNKESVFLMKYDSIKKAKSKSFIMLEDNFFKSKKPSAKYYALFCNFCLCDNKNESLSEGFALNTFELFKNNKAKSNILLKYIYQLNAEERDAILTSIIKLMCLDLGDNEYNIERFNADFKVLSKNIEVQKTAKKCLDEVVL